MPSVLVVDDETSIAQLVAYNFSRAGYEVETESNGRTAFHRIEREPGAFDLIVLDLMLPGMDGMEVCKRLRSANISTPVILLTAKDEEVDLILGLEMGADDYVTKPFSPRELVARAKAVLRRFELANQPAMDAKSSDRSSDIGGLLVSGPLCIDVGRHEVSVDGRVIELTPKEFDLLRYLLANRERVLSRDQLLDHVWGYSAAMDTRIVDVHISHLRDKIEVDPRRPAFIRTVRGIGYRFTEPTVG